MDFRPLNSADIKKTIQYAIDGMHFHIYFQSDFMTWMYGKYFFYSETLRATQQIAAYDGDHLLGILIAHIDGEPRQGRSFRMAAYVWMFEAISRIFFRGSAGEYSAACDDMLESYLASNARDGEIVFLAADPNCGRKGIGTALLGELARREKGKTITLFTDDQCSFSFYEHRGFRLMEERNIVLKLKKPIPLRCMLYAKTLE